MFYKNRIKALEERVSMLERKVSFLMKPLQQDTSKPMKSKTKVSGVGIKGTTIKRLKLNDYCQCVVDNTIAQKALQRAHNQAWYYSKVLKRKYKVTTNEGQIESRIIITRVA